MDHIVRLTPGMTQRLEAVDGQSYLLTGSAGRGDLPEELIAVRQGADLRIVFGDGGELTVSGFFAVDASVSGPGGLDLRSTDVPAETSGAPESGDQILARQGSPEDLIALARQTESPSLLEALDEALGTVPQAGDSVTRAASAAPELEDSAAPETTAGAGSSGLGLLGLLGLGAAALGGAGGGSGGGAALPAADRLSGQLMAGPFAEGNDFKVFLYDDAGSPLLEGVGQELASDGTFSFELPDGVAGAPVIVHAVNMGSSPDYRDEATGQLIDATSNFMTVLNPTTGTNTVSVTPLTTIAAKRMGVGEVAPDGVAAQTQPKFELDPDTGMAPNKLTAGAVTQGNSEVAEAFGLSDIVTQTVEPTISAEGADTSETASAYGQVLAMLSGVHQETGGSKAEVLDLYAESIEVDGTAGATSGARLSDAAARKLASGAEAAKLTREDLFAETSDGEGSASTGLFSAELFDEVVEAKAKLAPEAQDGASSEPAVLELADFAALGLSSVTEDNIAAVNNGISATRAARSETDGPVGVGEIEDIVTMTLSGVALASDTGASKSDGITTDGRLKVTSDFVDLRERAFDVEYRSAGVDAWARLGENSLTLNEAGEAELGKDVLPAGRYEGLEFRLVTTTSNGKLIGEVYNGLPSLEIDQARPVLQDITLSADGGDGERVLWTRLSEVSQIEGPLTGQAEVLSFTFTFDQEDVAQPDEKDFVLSGAEFVSVARDPNDKTTWTLTLRPTRSDEGAIEIGFAEGAFADVAGNTAFGVLPVSLEYDPVAPVMELADWGKDDLVPAGDLNFGFTHTLFESVSPDVAEGDVTVTLTSGEGEITPSNLRRNDQGEWRLRLEEEEIASLLSPQEVGGPPNGPPTVPAEQITVEVTATDTAGNTSTVTDSFMMERPLPTSHSASTVVAGDNIINSQEAADGQVTMTGTTSYVPEGWKLSGIGQIVYKSGVDIDVTDGVVDAQGDWEAVITSEFPDAFEPEDRTPVLEGIWFDQNDNIKSLGYNSHEYISFSIDQIAPEVESFDWVAGTDAAADTQKAQIAFSEAVVTGFDNQYGADDPLTADQFEVTGGRIIDFAAVEDPEGATFELTIEVTEGVAPEGVELSLNATGVTDIAGNELAEPPAALPLIA